ncbi:hypothetical protein Pla123a_16520 [Posidoniimonas polymericola]|uniref:Uncharacterized protein n=1 Tax=Posidoniimonas polymericola TaxID=2528002 RepID=A0A5C5YS81_9BACT|nr:hypothetical protein Pla123a_16520 [Posidoniimonas polymericola]
MPPGAIGAQRLLRGGPLSGYVQPVRVFASEGVTITAASHEGYAQGGPKGLLAGLQVGGVYAFSISNVPNMPEAEVYATVEVIDRLHPPCGKELRFPVPVELTDEELRLAANASFVTRVIYVEDPRMALPVAEETFSKNGGQQWFEARPGDDPLVTADILGRPIAILRIGSRKPALPTLPMQFYEHHETPTADSDVLQTSATAPAEPAESR